MTNIDSTERTITRTDDRFRVDEAELAAVAFLARYSGRTLDAYRHDLRNLFRWAADHHLAVLEATCAHLEMYRSSMEERGLAASTIDRRLSTACGFYRFAHIDGRITSNPAQYVRRPTVHPSEQRGMDRSELGRFLFTAERVD
jgi:site-specific recombinase XerD